MRALIASGAGRYGDPWHPFRATSEAVAGILDSSGFMVDIDEDVDHALASLEGVSLLVVNAGDPWRVADSVECVPAASRSGFARAVERGVGILALHAAVSSLRDYPEWAPLVGGMWIPGLSWHPPISDADITGGTLPDGEPVAGFRVFDERYCRLQRLGDSDIVAWHESGVDASSREPSAWVRASGAVRAAVDVLGHDARSYESEGHRRLITQLACWAAAGEEPAAITRLRDDGT